MKFVGEFVICLAILLFGSSMCIGEQADTGPRMTDAEFFSALNPDYPGLEKVKAAINLGDTQKAKHELVEYMRNREKPIYNPDWLGNCNHGKRTEKTNTTDADRILRREFKSVGVVHKFDGEIDWTLNPINYAEWTYALNRHSFWAQLARAYWETGEEKYAKEFVYQMTDWVKKCPVPLNDSGNAGLTWRTIETGIRTGMNWNLAFEVFRKSPEFTDDAMVIMLKSFVEHAHQLIRWPTSGNWLSMECEGLTHCGVLYPEFKEAADWRKTAIDRLYTLNSTVRYIPTDHRLNSQPITIR